MPGWLRTSVVMTVALVAIALASALGRSAASVQAVPAGAPTPGPGAMTVYSVTNTGATTANVEHVFSNPSGFSYSFWAQIAAGSSETVHVRDIAQIPSPFNGTLTVNADQPVSAQVVGYDYPSSPTSTATAGSATSTPTLTATPSGATATPTRTPTPIGSGIQAVQSALGYTGSTVSSQGASFGAPVASGDLVVVAVSSWNGANTATVSAVTDTFGNVYAKAVEDPSPATGGLQPLSLWYAPNVVGGSNFVVTAHLANPGDLSVAIHEYRGAGALDQVAHASGTGTSASAGSLATSQAQDLLFAATTDSTGGTTGATVGAGYTTRISQPDNTCCEALFTADGIAGSAGPYAATFTYANPVTFRASLAAFRPLAAPTQTPTPASSFLTVTASVDASQAVPGQALHQTIDVHSGFTGNGVTILQVVGTLPAGFAYVPGSTSVQICTPCQSVGIADPTQTTSGGRVRLTWNRSDQLSGATSDLMVTFGMTAGTPGSYTSDVAASDNLGQTVTASGVAPVAVAAVTPVANGAIILQAGQPTVVSTVVAGSPVSVGVPGAPIGSTPIAQLVIRAAPTPLAIVPRPPVDRFVQAIEVDAYDGPGNPIHQLAAPVTISQTFRPPPGVNPSLVEIYTLDLSGATQILPTTVIANGDGTYTATAQTSHLSPFGAYGPGLGTPVPQAYIPGIQR